MTIPTIAKANIINSYAAWLEQPEIPENGEGIDDVAVETLKVLITDNKLYIYSAEAVSTTATVYTPAGQQCVKVLTELADGHACIELSTLPAGTYIVAVSDSNGNTETLKIRIE